MIGVTRKEFSLGFILLGQKIIWRVISLHSPFMGNFVMGKRYILANSNLVFSTLGMCQSKWNLLHVPVSKCQDSSK